MKNKMKVELRTKKNSPKNVPANSENQMFMPFQTPKHFRKFEPWRMWNNKYFEKVRRLLNRNLPMSWVTIKGHLTSKLNFVQHSFRFTFSWPFSYISFSSFTFPRSQYRILFLYLLMLPCRFFLVSLPFLSICLLMWSGDIIICI